MKLINVKGVKNRPMIICRDQILYDYYYLTEIIIMS